VAKRYVVPIGVLFVVMLFAEFVPGLFERDDPRQLERYSDAFGWTPATDSRDLAQDVFQRVNDERLARGLPPLAWHVGLANIAERWSETMIAEQRYEHSTPEFRAHPDFYGSGENIAMGQSDAAEVHVGWMRSDGHRQSILDPNVTAIGIGIVCRSDGRMWATQVFGAPHGGSYTPPTMPPAEPVVRTDPGPACPTPMNQLFPSWSR
jgi:hypothetical protein